LQVKSQLYKQKLIEGKVYEMIDIRGHNNILKSSKVAKEVERIKTE